MNVATNGVFLFYYSRQNYQKIDITIFWHLHFYKKKLCNRLHAPPFPPTHKSQIPIGGGWGSCGMQTKGTVLLVCICQRHTKRTVPLVCFIRFMPHEPHPPPIGIWDLWVGGKGGRVNDCITFFIKMYIQKFSYIDFFGNFAENSRI